MATESILTSTIRERPAEDASPVPLKPVPDLPALSIVMPAHNEERTIRQAVTEVLALDTGFPFELIVIDDGSSDRTPLLLQSIEDPRLTVHRHPMNLGKGVAVLTGAALATGTHLVVFDADGEYSASDIPKVFEPIAKGRAKIVYGSRRFGENTVFQSFRYALGNRATTFAANVLFDSYVTDLHTCMKMVPTDLFRQLQLHERGFGLDSEITAELLRRSHRPFEVPITYVSRSRSEGKQITWRDGFVCLWVLTKVRFRGKVRCDSDAASPLMEPSSGVLTDSLATVESV